MKTSAFPEEISRLLFEHYFGVLATNQDGHPYTSLITINISNDCRHLYFPTLRNTQKYRNLAHNNKVSVLLDNRSIYGESPSGLYALSVIGAAQEVNQENLATCQDQFIQKHPHLRSFIGLTDSAMLQVDIVKIILVEEFQNVRVYEPTGLTKPTVLDNAMDKHRQKIQRLKFSEVYPLYRAKVQRKGHNPENVDVVITWLTGYDAAAISWHVQQQSTFETFFDSAPAFNPASRKITGLICGYRVEEITDPLVQKVRYLDKLVDELSNGKSLEKVCRREKNIAESSQ
jgi:uncharacterized pyridoxamine 5'-phosphate oxidase family protein